jgi:iron complex transport system permease protein
VRAEVAAANRRLSPRGVPRVGGRSSRTDGRPIVMVAGSVVALVGLCASLVLGDYPIAVGDVLSVLGGGTGSARRTAYVVLQLRVPRAVGAVVVGAGFGLAGAIFQRVVRNPLATPDIIGINAGSALAAVLLIVVAAIDDPLVIAAGAMVGALLTAAAIYGLAYRRGVNGYRLVLIGIGVTAGLASLTAYLLTTADLYTAGRAAVWLSGTLAGRSWGQILPVLVAMSVLVPAALGLAHSLRALELGDELARALGTRVDLARLGLLLVGVLLAGVATAAAGPVAFIALAGPQIARRLVRERGLALMTSAACGAALLSVADLIARLFAPVELPVGVLTAVLGAPLLIWLLARANRVGSGG